MLGRRRRRRDAAAWFDAALQAKWRRDWAEAVALNLQAVEAAGLRDDDGSSTGDPTWWNLGIAATALHDWSTAERAWRAYGVPDDVEWGMTPVRVDPAGEPEVVWCQRLDPARARIENVPLPDSGRSWGDIVLHDGVPNGERVVGARVYPVFDEIEVWEASSVPTRSAER